MAPYVALVLVLELATVAVLLVGTDRRRKTRRGRYPAPPWSGFGAMSVPVDVAVEPEQGLALAAAAIARAGGREVATVDTWTVVGWKGATFRSWGQELAVAVTAPGEGRTRLVCCSRPRFGLTLVHWGASGTAVNCLADEVRGAAGLAPAR